MIAIAAILAMNTLPQCPGGYYSNEGTPREGWQYCSIIGSTTNSNYGTCAPGWEMVMRSGGDVACAKTDDLNNHPVSR